MTATRRLHERLPDSQTWVVRIGYRAAIWDGKAKKIEVNSAETDLALVRSRCLISQITHSIGLAIPTTPLVGLGDRF
jgi:hypothetical protein